MGRFYIGYVEDMLQISDSEHRVNLSLNLNINDAYEVVKALHSFVNTQNTKVCTIGKYRLEFGLRRDCMCITCRFEEPEAHYIVLYYDYFNTIMQYTAHVNAVLYDMEEMMKQGKGKQDSGELLSIEYNFINRKLIFGHQADYDNESTVKDVQLSLLPKNAYALLESIIETIQLRSDSIRAYGKYSITINHSDTGRGFTISVNHVDTGEVEVHSYEVARDNTDIIVYLREMLTRISRFISLSLT